MESYGDYSSLNGLLSGFIIIILIMCLIGIAISIFQLVATWVVYKKAGEKGWKSIVPVYRDYVLVEIAGLNWWWFLIPMLSGFFMAFFNESTIMVFLICVVAIFSYYNIYFNLAKKFNRSAAFAVGLFLCPVVFIPILAFSKNSTYDNTVNVSPNGCLDYIIGNYNKYKNNNVNKSTDTVDSNNEHSFCSNCGTKLVKDAKFCPNCGKEIK